MRILLLCLHVWHPWPVPINNVIDQISAELFRVSHCCVCGWVCIKTSHIKKNGSIKVSSHYQSQNHVFHKCKFTTFYYHHILATGLIYSSVGLWTFTLKSCHYTDFNSVFQTDLFMHLSRGKNAVIRHLGWTLLQQLLASTSLSTVPKTKSGWLGDGGQGEAVGCVFLDLTFFLVKDSSQQVHLPWKKMVE